WLEPEYAFATGAVESAFLAALKGNVATAWQPFVAAGFHTCGFCKDRRHGESLNLWIPGEDVVFIAPSMVLHYVTVHAYCPPDDFVRAVLQCPAQGSDLFLERVHRFWTSPMPSR